MLTVGHTATAGWDAPFPAGPVELTVVETEAGAYLFGAVSILLGHMLRHGIGEDGRVDRMPLVSQHPTLQMTWCLECHRAPEKFIRPREQVFNMRYEQPTTGKPVTVESAEFTDQVALGRALIKKYNVRPPMDITTCSTCHR